jgi:hypothetical protein
VLAAPPVVTVPGTLPVSATVPAGFPEGDHAGFVVLRKDAVTRRIPFWFTVSVPRLASEAHAAIRSAGTYSGTTSGKPSLVSSYRYPTDPAGAGAAASLPGPEQVYGVTIPSGAANFGVVVLSGKAEARIVLAGNETRLAGYTALPLYLNPYTGRYGEHVRAVGVTLPAPGAYDIVLDTHATAQAGAYTFHYWVNDTAPPTIRLVTAKVAARGAVVVALTDTGSGVDPGSILVRVDGAKRAHTFNRAAGRLTVRLGSLRRGRHTLVVTAADWQETKNNENQGRILPNTRTLTTRFVVR